MEKILRFRAKWVVDWLVFLKKLPSVDGCVQIAIEKFMQAC